MNSYRSVINLASSYGASPLLSFRHAESKKSFTNSVATSSDVYIPSEGVNQQNRAIFHGDSGVPRFQFSLELDSRSLIRELAVLSTPHHISTVIYSRTNRSVCSFPGTKYKIPEISHSIFS